MDARVDADTNHYSVPPQFIGETVEVVIEADRLRVHWQDRIIAEHSVAMGRHHVVEDPAHVLSLLNGQKARLGTVGIQRDLSEYEQVVGGEAW